MLHVSGPCFSFVQGFKSQAMAVTCDPEHKFELALQNADLKMAHELAKEAEVSDCSGIFTIYFIIAFVLTKAICTEP